jgi:RHS repeat-associated protein
MALHLFHCDHLGTPVWLINHKNGKVEWNADIDVWGNVQRCDNPHNLRQSIRMQGQHFDEESGLHYNRHRYYDPAQGRYITQDPIGLRGGWNGYNYVTNPVERIDPLGLSDGFGGYIQAQGSLGINMTEKGATPQEISNAASGLARGDGYGNSWYLDTNGTASLDLSLSADGMVGGSFAAGLSTGKEAGTYIPDLCAYLTACQHLGVGIATSVALTGSVSNAAPSSGITKTIGVLATGGALGDGAIAGTVDLNNPKNATASAGVGVGAGVFAGFITCQTYTKCTIH